MNTDSKDVLDRIESDRGDHLDRLKQYLSIPSISTDPAYREEVLRCADFLLEQMRSAGLTAEKIEGEGYPLVYGEWTGAPGKPTVLFYGHYDVQPVDPEHLWRNPPFEPTVEGDQLFARGATDDKGQSFTHLMAVAAMLAERGSLPVNVKFLVEGEEESGGAAIETFVTQDAGQRLACDCVVVSDTSMLGPGQPSLIYGLKGLLYTEIQVSGPSHDLHSGSFGGGVTNPVNALCQIIAGLRDPVTGRVLIPGFYDDVRPLEDWERTEFGALPYDEQAFMHSVGVNGLSGEEGFTTRERLWGRPTCDVNGIWGGYQDEGAKTIIPAAGGAKVSMRLVPDQDPAKIAAALAEYVRAAAPPGVTAEVTSMHGTEAVVVETGGPLVEAALDAMQDVWGARPVRVREGGSIPVVSIFDKVLGVPVLLLGFGLADDGLHSPNEKFDISHYHGGIRSIARMLDCMAGAESTSG